MPTDKYDEQIERLSKSAPDEIADEWDFGVGLFRFCIPTMSLLRGEYGCECGCLTMIRNSRRYGVPCYPDLTDEIRADERIPLDRDDIRIEHLPVFAEWQRKLDREIRAEAAYATFQADFDGAHRGCK